MSYDWCLSCKQHAGQSGLLSGETELRPRRLESCSLVMCAGAEGSCGLRAQGSPPWPCARGVKKKHWQRSPQCERGTQQSAVRARNHERVTGRNRSSQAALLLPWLPPPPPAGLLSQLFLGFCSLVVFDLLSHLPCSFPLPPSLPPRSVSLACLRPLQPG